MLGGAGHHKYGKWKKYKIEDQYIDSRTAQEKFSFSKLGCTNRLHSIH